MFVKRDAPFILLVLALFLLSLYACTSSSTPPLPVPGNNGTITVSDESATSIKLSWTRATDDSTSQEDLEYRVYLTTVRSIDTVAEVEANATPVGDWERDMTSKHINALEEGIDYYFTVLVCNKEGYMSAYNVVSNTSVSGRLLVGTGAGTGNESEPPGDFPFSNLRLPDEPHPMMIQSTTMWNGDVEPPFVPDEIIVQYKPGVDPLTVQGLAQAGGYQAWRISPPYEGLHPALAGQGLDTAYQSGDFAAVAAFRRSGAMTVLKLPPHERDRLSPPALRDRTLREIERLNTLPSVEFAQPNYLYKLTAIPNDNFYHLQWHYPLIKLNHVWSESLVSGLEDVTVAVIDTGIARSNGVQSGSNHVDFGGGDSSPFVDEYDFISLTSMSLDGDGYDDDATDPGDNPDPDLASFHGTHVIGTIGAFTGNATGIAGVAGGVGAGSSVRIMPLRALGYGGGTTADIVDAVKYAAQIPNSTGKLPSNKADIINLSLGSTSDDEALKNALDTAYANGILIVAAAGNSGTPQGFYPAGYSSVMSVSAVDIGAEITSYSNYGGTIEVAAPGGSFSFDLNFDSYVDGVLSTFTERLGTDNYKMDLYAFLQGTSMAAPHVAGLAALVKAKNPSLTAVDIRNRIINSATDLGNAGRDDFYGHGLINAYAAINGGPGSSTVLFPFPKKLKLLGNNPSAAFTLKNINDSSSILVTGITRKNNAPWLSVSPATGSANGTGLEITVIVNTTDYPLLKDDTTHTEMLTISSSAGDEHVYVLYNSSGFPDTVPQDIGTVYVVAVDVETMIIEYYTITNYENGYEYRISPITTGEYNIGASTDHDEDLIIFEPEDYYGFYISPDQIVPVDVLAGCGVTDIDFTMLLPSVHP